MYNYEDLYNIAMKQISSQEIEPLPITYAYSDTQFEILVKYIKEFEESLDSEHEVGLLLTNFGKTVTMQVTEISYEKSVLMIFKGYVDGRMSTLIQHISQLNFCLRHCLKMILVRNNTLALSFQLLNSFCNS